MTSFGVRDEISTEDWTNLPFDEAVLINPKVTLKKGVTYPFVEMANIDSTSRIVQTLEKKVYNGGGSKFEDGDTLMARITPCLENGKISRYKSNINDSDIGFGSTEFIVIRGREGVTDNNFAYYLTTWSEFRNFSIGQMNGSSGRQRVPTSSLSKFIVKLPPLPVQKKIAAILSSLDDKIEQNTRMNKVLEEIARALFQRWFVEFEFPNAEGKPYKSAGGKMVGSEMGSVPEGWKVNTLDTVVDIIGGGTPKTSVSEYWNGTIPWFSVIDAPNDGDIFVIDTEKHITQLGIENSSTRLLPVGTTIISARGTVGKCAVVSVPMTMNQSCYGIRGKEEGIDYFVYFTIRGMVSELQSKGHGSVFNTITRDTINSQMIVVPDVSVMKNYNDYVTPLLQKIQTNLTENRHLSELRDGLLPKLMSGEVEV